MQVADVEMARNLEARKLGGRAGAAPPDRLELLGDLKMRGAGIQLRRRRAFAVACGVESPAVISALQFVVIDVAQAKLHAAMRAMIGQGAELPLRIAIQGEIPPRQTNARDGVFLELAAQQDRVPMIQNAHGIVYLPLVSGEW